MCKRVDTCINKHFSFKIFLLNLPFEKFLDPCLITANQIRVYNMLLCFASAEKDGGDATISYNEAIQSVTDFRSYHIQVVTK